MLRRTRLAPTPSGYLHAGNAFNFLLTAALAQQAGAAVLLRIDDLDRDRYRPVYAQDIFDTLHFLKISWDEGPTSVAEFESRWSQRWRMNLYEEALQKLVQANAVFACTCSRTQSSVCRCEEKSLPLNTPAASWRLRTDEEPVTIKNLDGTVKRESLPASLQNFIVRKKDGLPAYQLTSVVDDLQFGVDLIVRGEDLWPSTLAQQFLATQLGEKAFASIAFYHHHLLTNANGEKLSKSAGDTSIKHWREEGRTREDLVAYLSKRLPPGDSVFNGSSLFPQRT